ncbi:MAG: threonylcarbamoyl-AMP synthase [Alphaproteobacteria bacterium]|nr:threonylcarbamoyl-AMP synthase [Alphaproteobacteria bacterium SS10]
MILPASSDGIARAAKALRDGSVVAFGTETVYGLGALAANATAVDAIFTLKQRPQQNPLICHVDGRDMAETIARVDARAAMVMGEFWPGPLTLILPQRDDAPLAKAATAGLPSVAVRAPAHGTARELISAVGAPLVAPSANKSGRLSPTTAAMVADGFRGEIDYVLSGGKCEIGLESTVLDLSGTTPTILRLGAVTADDLAHLLPDIASVDTVEDTAPRSPGQMLRHYAPSLPLRINVRDAVAADEAYIGFGPNPFPAKGGAVRVNLSKVGDLDQAARNLFATLREVEESGAKAIAVAPIPEHGIGAAINDRLRRAAAATAEFAND